jgi:hypothetical protein
VVTLLLVIPIPCEPITLSLVFCVTPLLAFLVPIALSRIPSMTLIALAPMPVTLHPISCVSWRPLLLLLPAVTAAVAVALVRRSLCLAAAAVPVRWAHSAG